MNIFFSIFDFFKLSVRSLGKKARYLAFYILRIALPRNPYFGPPKGSFSAAKCLKDGRLKGQLLLSEQSHVPPTDGNLREIAGLGQNNYQPWPIFWTLHTEARLIGPTALLVDKNKMACAEAFFNHHSDGDSGYHTVFLPKEEALSGNWTSIVSLWGLGSNYYHWMMDCLPRLAMLENFPSDTKIIVPSSLAKFQETTLSWLGLANRIYKYRGNHIVENFYFSSPTAMTGCANPYAVKFLRNSFLTKGVYSNHVCDKIYIKRQGNNRGILNAVEVEAFLKKRGWQIIELEELSLAEQIGLFSSARAVCGLHGAGFTNLLWCNATCIAIEFLAHNFLNGCYEALAECLKVNHNYIIFQGDRRFRIHIDISVLEKKLPN